jgi:hypothetical protein
MLPHSHARCREVAGSTRGGGASAETAPKCKRGTGARELGGTGTALHVLHVLPFAHLAEKTQKKRSQQKFFGTLNFSSEITHPAENL